MDRSELRGLAKDQERQLWASKTYQEIVDMVPKFTIHYESNVQGEDYYVTVTLLEDNPGSYIHLSIDINTLGMDAFFGKGVGIIYHADGRVES